MTPPWDSLTNFSTHMTHFKSVCFNEIYSLFFLVRTQFLLAFWPKTLQHIICQYRHCATYDTFTTEHIVMQQKPINLQLVELNLYNQYYICVKTTHFICLPLNIFSGTLGFVCIFVCVFGGKTPLFISSIIVIRYITTTTIQFCGQ